MLVASNCTSVIRFIITAVILTSFIVNLISFYKVGNKRRYLPTAKAVLLITTSLEITGRLATRAIAIKSLSGNLSKLDAQEHVYFIGDSLLGSSLLRLSSTSVVEALLNLGGPGIYKQISHSVTIFLYLKFCFSLRFAFVA